MVLQYSSTPTTNPPAGPACAFMYSSDINPNMQKLFTIILFTLFCSIWSNAQPVVKWQATLGGTMNDRAQSFSPTPDGGYIAIGASNSTNGNVTGNHGGTDCWIAKLDSVGVLQWQKALGGTGEDFGTSILPTADRGYIMAGYTSSNDGDVSGNHGQGSNTDYWVVKLDSTGSIQWQKALGGSNIDQATSIRITRDGGYVVAGRTGSGDGNVMGFHGGMDFWIVKLDTLGTVQWQSTLGGGDEDDANSIIQTSDGGYIVAGGSYSANGDVTNNYGAGDVWIVKLDTVGAIQWQKNYGGSGDEQANSIAATADSGYIIVGYTSSNDVDVSGNHGDSDYWLLRIDSVGAIMWQQTLGGPAGEYAYSVAPDPHGGYVMAGVTFSYGGQVTGLHGGSDCWIVKLNDTGTIEWQKALGGTSYDAAYDIQPLSTGGYVLAAYTSSHDGDVTGAHGVDDYWILKLDTGTSTPINVGVPALSPQPTAGLYPNPATGQVTITTSAATIQIEDVLGQSLRRIETSGPSKTIDVTDLSAGVYVVRLISAQGQSSLRLEVVR